MSLSVLWGDNLASIVSKRYAQSLYEAARAEGITERILKEVCSAARILQEYPEYRGLLLQPAIPLDEKKKSLRAVFAGRVHSYLLNFLLLITEKGRLCNFEEMADAYRQLYASEERIVEIDAVTAVPLAETACKKLKEKMEVVTGRTVILRNTVDPEIIGGILLRSRSKQINATVKHRIDELVKLLGETIA